MPTPSKTYPVGADVGKAALVIDTNVVLNWLFFADAPTAATIHALLGQHRWVCTAWMAREAQRVATTAQLAKYASTAATAALAQGFAQHATVLEHGAISPLRCRDPDDQAFLDLAAHTQAPLLLTLDNDLLKLRKRAATLGLCIASPLSVARAAQAFKIAP
jgi:putative PIN family toxin of toxin-antitoxin system